MKCKVDECDREAMYIAQQVCQKHYFRYMRNGTYELKKVREHGVRAKKYRYQNPAGYELINEPEHKLADKRGYVYEHRFVYYNDIDNNPEKCALCFESINWGNCHIDHIDEDVSNNKPSNLRALCRPCNVFRGHTSESMGKHILEVNGKKMTASAWARQPGVEVCGATIVRRFKAGMSDYDSIYSKRVTHHNTKTKKLKTKYDDVRGISMKSKPTTKSS